MSFISNMFALNRQSPSSQQQQPQAGQQQLPTPGSSMQLGGGGGQQPQAGHSGAPGQQQPQGNQPGQAAGNGQQSNSPLDNFKDMWNTNNTGDGQQQPQDPWSTPLFQTDPARIREAAGKMDFISQIPQELMQKAMSGNDPQAFLQVINQVGQLSLSTALQLSTATTEQAGTKLGERFKTTLPAHIKEYQLNTQEASDPIFNQPGAKQMLAYARAHAKQQNPDWSVKQINDHAENFLRAFAQGLNPGQQQQAPTAGDGNFNWDSWAASGESQ